MDNATRTRIVTAAVAAAASRGGNWQAADVGVKSTGIPGMDRNGCIFIVAIDTTHVKDGILVWYALLPGGRIAGVDITGNAAAATVLRLCGEEADANWWAEVIALLSKEAAGTSPAFYVFPNAVSEVRKAGLEFKPPMLTHSEGATTVEFFARLGEIEEPLQIRATLPDRGDLTVVVKSLGAAQ